MTTQDGTGPASSPVDAGGDRGPGAPPSSTAHVWRLVIVLVVVLGTALVVRWMVYPSSFGQFGYFRGAAMQTLMEEPRPSHVGRETCGECHEDELEVLLKDVHGRVECETCHGPGSEHVAVMSGEAEGEGAILVPDSREACLTCHRRLAARPAGFPQIDPVEHYELHHITDPTVACFECHSPHEPLFLERPVAEARLHPVLNECVDCHKHEQDPQLPRPEDHPIIYQCDYCHSAIARDFADRPHARFRCGTCHQFFPISERGGRMLKHEGVRFCLLCHQQRDFRGEGAPPGIPWPEHITEMGLDPGDEDAVCSECHREAFHLTPAELGIRPRED